MAAWQRSGWVTEYPGRSDRDTLVDYLCDKCGMRIGIPDWQVEDPGLLKKILKTADCKCRKKRA